MATRDSILSELAFKCKEIFIKEEKKFCYKSYHRGFRCGFATLLEAFPPKGQKWIALKEKYPPYNQYVLIKREQLEHNKDECLVALAWYNDWDELFTQTSPKGIHADITHWMPLLNENLYVQEYETSQEGANGVVEEKE